MALPPASSIFHVDSRICAPRNRTTNSSDIALSDLGTIRTSGEPICRDTRLLDGQENATSGHQLAASPAHTQWRVIFDGAHDRMGRATVGCARRI
jgi:hypothetical protein